MSRDILVHEMNSGKLFDKTEKLTRTEIVDLMINARECAFTVVFHKLLDDAYVTQTLADATAKTFSDPSKLKELSKKLTHGKEVEMTCFQTSSEGHLGRSRVIDLNAPWGMNYRQVDHRTIQSLVLKNVKYVVK